jgi:hypothetical protein
MERSAGRGAGKALTDADGRVWARVRAADGHVCLQVDDVGLFVASDHSGEVRVRPVRGRSFEEATRAAGLGAAAFFAHRAGLDVLHASAVELSGGVVGFCGVKGAGKSTIAYALAARGAAQWSDDVLAVDASRVPPHAVALPFVPRLRPTAATFFSQAARSPVPSVDEERDPVPLRALFLLDRRSGAGETPAVARVQGTDAFLEAFASSVFLDEADADRRAQAVESILALAAAVPLLRLRFASGLSRLEPVLDAVEHAVSTRAH